jgi:serine/threonine-protein kinase
VVDDAPRILGGRYEVGELIGRGGMAEVHIGHDTRLGRTVAIKILRSDLARDPSFQARFRREAQAAASLNHPAIVAVYDTGEDVFTEPTGGVAHVPFIVMEYVEGHTVRDILRDGSAVPIEEAVEITAGVLSALEYSHHAGIVHRDIKPANVMLTPTGAVKVMDFGIARAMADAAGTMTQTQAVIGTAQYLSPEQARGEQVDSRSDLYSTGCLLFELLTGRPPFIGDSPVAVAYQHAREEAQPPSTFASDVPDGLDRITMKALAKDREARYSTAAEFRSDLESAIRGGRVAAPALGALGAAALGAAALSDGPATAATQVIGAGTSPTQVVPAAAPWSQTGAGSAAGEGVTGLHGGPPEPDEAPRRRWLVWTLVGIAIAAIAGIILVLSLGGDDETPAVEVELQDLTGMEETAAQQLVTGLGLTYKPLAEPSTEIPEGHVTKSDPAGPTTVPEGSTVTVWISQGPDAVEIPDMENFTQDQADAELERLGLTNVRVETRDSPTVEKDRVVGTEPAAGESVLPTDEIVLLLSTGQVQLPDLLNPPRTQEQASAELTALGLVPIFQTEESDAAPGTVIAQSRPAGPVLQRSQVTLTVAIARTVTEVQVPEVAGKSYSEAAAALGAEGLNAAPGEDVFDPDVPAGRVVRTDPAAGATVAEGSTVTVFVSKGPEVVAPGGEGDKKTP